jgi:uncharacterized protein
MEPLALPLALPLVASLGGLGFVVGLLMALTGAGGGALGVPLLVLTLGLPMQQAAPMALIAVGLSGAVGAVLGLRDQLLRWRAALMIGAAGMLVAPLGVALAQRLPQALLLSIFAVFMLYTAWRMWRSAPAQAARPVQPACVRPDGELRLRWTPRCAAVLARVGGTAGLFSAAAASHGQLPLQAALPFAAASVVGLLAGRQLAPRFSAELMRRGFAVMAVGVAALVLWRALLGPA